jgi:hypothetical protein
VADTGNDARDAADSLSDAAHDANADDASGDTGKQDADGSDAGHSDAGESDAGAPDPCATPVPRAPIVGVELSTTVFVGRPALPAAERPELPTAVDDFSDYRAAFAFGDDPTGRADGELTSGSPTFTPTGDNLLAWSVFLFFENGGGEAIIVPTLDDIPTADELAQLESLSHGGLLVVPGLSAASSDRARRDGFNSVESALNSPSNKGFFFIGDLPTGLTISAITASTGGSSIPASPLGLHHDRAALYHPWLEVTSALDSSQSATVPPSGAVAGVVARTDRDRGIWKAPAGVGADLRSIQGLAQSFDDNDINMLTQTEINALRVVNGEAVVWGARTRESTSLEWKYMSTRRLAMHVEESIDRGTEWAAFETNDAALWSKLESDVQNFLMGLWTSGAFQGATTDESYFARVDATTTTSADIANGVANIMVGIAALRPAEFIILSIERPAGTCVE